MSECSEQELSVSTDEDSVGSSTNGDSKENSKQSFVEKSDPVQDSETFSANERKADSDLNVTKKQNTNDDSCLDENLNTKQCSSTSQESNSSSSRFDKLESEVKFFDSVAFMKPTLERLSAKIKNIESLLSKEKNSNESCASDTLPPLKCGSVRNSSVQSTNLSKSASVNNVKENCAQKNSADETECEITTETDSDLIPGELTIGDVYTVSSETSLTDFVLAVNLGKETEVVVKDESNSFSLKKINRIQTEASVLNQPDSSFENIVQDIKFELDKALNEPIEKLTDLYLVCRDKIRLYKWLQNIGLLSKYYKCPICKKTMPLIGNPLRWQCRHTQDKKSIVIKRSLYRGSFFSLCRLNLNIVLYIAYFWFYKIRLKQVLQQLPCNFTTVKTKYDLFDKLAEQKHYQDRPDSFMSFLKDLAEAYPPETHD